MERGSQAETQVRENEILSRGSTRIIRLDDEQVAEASTSSPASQAVRDATTKPDFETRYADLPTADAAKDLAKARWDWTVYGQTMAKIFEVQKRLTAAKAEQECQAKPGFFNRRAKKEAAELEERIANLEADYAHLMTGFLEIAAKMARSPATWRKSRVEAQQIAEREWLAVNAPGQAPSMQLPGSEEDWDGFPIDELIAHVLSQSPPPPAQGAAS